jgi:hypothetical protein
LPWNILKYTYTLKRLSFRMPNHRIIQDNGNINLRTTLTRKVCLHLRGTLTRSSYTYEVLLRSTFTSTRYSYTIEGQLLLQETDMYTNAVHQHPRGTAILMRHSYTFLALLTKLISDSAKI